MSIITLESNVKSEDYRRDSRTLEEFKSDIKKETEKEKFLLSIFEKECKKRCIPFSATDYGVNNNGDFVEKSDCRPDYLIRIGDISGLFEIKSSPVDFKITFKVYDLQEYIRQNAYILLFIGTGYISDDLSKFDITTASWAILSPLTLSNMLKDCKQYKEKKFGYKQCIKVFSSNFHKYFTVHRFTVNV